MKDKLKNKNAITLIALVITIIVLLILAGVSIAMLTGKDGILSQAVHAKEKFELAKEEEERDLESINELIGQNEDSDTAIIERIIKNALNGRKTFNINELKVEVEKYKGTVKGVKPVDIVPTICQFPVTVTLGQTKFAVENNGNYWKIEEKDFVTPQQVKIIAGTTMGGKITIENVENTVGWTLSELMYNTSLLGAKYDPTSGDTDEEWIDKITDNGDPDKSDDGLKYWPVKIYGEQEELEDLEYIVTNKDNAFKFDDYKMQYKMMSILLDGNYDMDGHVQIKFQSDELKKYNSDDILILTVDTDTGEIKYLEVDDCNLQTRRIHSYI